MSGVFVLQVEHGVDADFELEYLLLEGHCFDQQTSQPPRGLQFLLSTPASDVVKDTIVMANLVGHVLNHQTHQVARLCC